MGQNQTKVASNEEEIAAKALEDDEPDDWDKRIFSTGCASRLGLGLFRELLAEARSTEEQTNMNDCYFDKKDWRVCSQEVVAFRECWKRKGNDQRTETKDA